jgi:small GTP-binding protein
VGDTGTGKSNIVYCYTKGKAPNNIMPTVAVEFTSKVIKFDNRPSIKAQIWDTAGQENYRSLTMKYFKNEFSYYSKVVGALIVFDVSRRSTYEHVPQWL